jgi:hypothetical protein
VLLNLPNERVYDIEVEHDNCYYANNILVSNSDSFRYLAVGLKKFGSSLRGNRMTKEEVEAKSRYYSRQ